MGGNLAQRHLDAGGQTHIQQVMPQRTLSAHRPDARVLADGKFR